MDLMRGRVFSVFDPYTSVPPNSALPLGTIGIVGKRISKANQNNYSTTSKHVHPFYFKYKAMETQYFQPFGTKSDPGGRGGNGGAQRKHEANGVRRRMNGGLS